MLLNFVAHIIYINTSYIISMHHASYLIVLIEKVIYIILIIIMQHDQNAIETNISLIIYKWNEQYDIDDTANDQRTHNNT